VSYREKKNLVSLYIWLHLFKPSLDDIWLAAAMIRKGHVIDDSTAFYR
jgi:hypothetical protein